MALLYYSTEYSPRRAQAEIQQSLIAHGARRISLEYDQGKIIGISFSIQTPAGERDFILPARVAGVRQVLKYQGVLRQRSDNGQSHAEAVAWRTLLEWVKLQMALVETSQARLDEVMLPYMMIDSPNDGVRYTLYEAFSQNALPPPGAR